MSMKRIGIVVIDMQRRFLRVNRYHPVYRYPLVFDLDEQVMAISRVLEYGSRSGVPRIMVKSDLGGEVFSDLRGFSYADTFTKPKDSAFSAKGFGELMEAHNLGQLILAGVNAGGCVYQTASDARSRGIEVVTSLDLLNDRGDWLESHGDFYEKEAILHASHEDLIDFLGQKGLAA